MTASIQDQLRDYAVQVTSQSVSVDLDEIVSGDVLSEPVTQTVGAWPEYPAEPIVSTRRRGWLVAVATAVAMLVVVGGASLLLQVTGPDTPVATTPPTTPQSLGTWSRVPHDDAVFGGGSSLSSVTVGGPGLVAVGRDEGMVLTSVDGITWSRVPYDEMVFGGSTMISVAAGGPGLVAVGWDGQVLDPSPDGDAAVWTSVDGVTWSRVPHDEEVFGAAFMVSVTAGGPGLVAVGGTDGIRTDGDAVVWTSVDGITWSRVPHDETIFGGPQRQTMYDVVVGGPGLVAVGREGDERPWDNSLDNAAAVWTSVDGITWTRVPHDETVFGTGGNPPTSASPGPVMLSVTAGGPGLVAVGRKAAWTSPDGVTWTRIADDVTVRSFMTGVTAGGPGLVAVGLDSSGATAVWTSVDGITWSQVPDDNAAFGRYPDWTYDVTVGGPGLVTVGNAGGDPAVWVWVAPTED